MLKSCNARGVGVVSLKTTLKRAPGACAEGLLTEGDRAACLIECVENAFSRRAWEPR
jgi:hypothetical protein